MKTKLFFATLILAFVFNSCSKDDSPASIVGTWKYSKEGAIVNGTEVLTAYSGNEAGCTPDKTEFKNDGTLIDTDYDSSNTPCEVFTTTGTWTKSGNTLTAVISGASFSVTILTLTSSKLKIKNPDGDIIEFIK